MEKRDMAANPTPTISELVERRISRRDFIGGAAAASALAPRRAADLFHIHRALLLLDLAIVAVLELFATAAGAGIVAIHVAP